MRQRRAEQIEHGVSGWLARGGGGVFATFTLQHHRGDRLSDRLDAVARSVWLCLQGAAWARRRARLGYVGAIKAVEVTYGENGWHPHAHALLLFERPLTVEEQSDLADWLYGRWLAVSERRGLGTPTRAHGVDVRAIGASTKDGERLAEYLTKVEGGWSAGAELARSDIKRAKRGGRTPVQLLAEFADTGDADALDLWREYERATHGKRAIVWSAGLQERLGVKDFTDVEAAASEGADIALLRFLIGRPEWQAALAWGTTGRLLDEIEDQAAAVFALAALTGREWVPIETRGINGGQAP